MNSRSISHELSVVNISYPPTTVAGGSQSRGGAIYDAFTILGLSMDYALQKETMGLGDDGQDQWEHSVVVAGSVVALRCNKRVGNVRRREPPL